MSPPTPDTLPAPSPPPLPVGEGYRRARLAKLRAVAVTSFRRRPWALLPVISINITLLALSGYPLTNVIVVAIASAFGVGVQFWASVALRTDERVEEITFAASMVITAVQAVVIGCTGGLASPFIPILVVLAANNVVAFGRSRKSVATVIVIAVIVIVIAMLPDELSSFEVPYPFNVAIAALILLTSIFVSGANIMQLTDVSDHAGITMERLSQDLVAQARARASSLERLSSDLAHELKNPLASVKSLTDLVARATSDERSRRHLSVIASEITRLEEIIRDYLTFSKPLEVIEPAPVELGGLLEDVVGVLEARAAGSQVALVRDPGAATVIADRRRIKEALINLVSNAIEATPPGGEVRVRAEPLANGAALRIRDSGKGLTPEELARIGTPFFTTRQGGTGLGVVLSRTVARQHGGDLSYVSEPGRGTEATLTLPDHPPEQSANA